MMTRTRFQERARQNQCLATRDCQFYQAFDGGLCSEHAGKLRSRSTERVDALTSAALHQLHASRDVDGMVTATLVQAVKHSSSSPTMVFAMLRGLWPEMTSALGAPRYISSTQALTVIRAIDEKVGVIDEETRRVIHSLVLSMCYDPWRLSLDDPVNSTALCYYGNTGAEPHSIEAVLGLLTHIRRFV